MRAEPTCGARAPAPPREHSSVARFDPDVPWDTSCEGLEREILKLQQALMTTTIYVTRDQVEAMTMGDRIAVMQLGVLQQVGSPETVYEDHTSTWQTGTSTGSASRPASRWSSTSVTSNSSTYRGRT